MAPAARKLVALSFLGLTVWSLVLGGAADCQPNRTTLAQTGPDLDVEEQAIGRAAGPACAQASPLPAPDDPAYSQISGDYALQWPLHSLAAVSAWALYPGAYLDAATRPTGSPIIAIVDTGVDPNHPDFMNPGAGSAEVSEGGQLLLSASYTFLTWEGDVPEDATDDHGHGTHLAGIIAAATNNGETAGNGIAGMGYPLRLLPLKVTDESGVATHADVAAAIIYAADQGASVMVIGLAGPTWSQVLQDAVDYAWDRGCLLIAPAGDAGSDQPMFPAACPHVFGAAPTTAAGALAWYASSGEQVALAAPGGDEAAGIYSTLPTYACTLRTDLTGPAYGELFGSGQAAAHVAAAAGLWLGLDGASCEADVANRLLWQALQESAASIEGDQAGWHSDAGYGQLSLCALLSGERPQETLVGSLVGRVLSEGVSVLGAAVEATGPTGGTYTASSSWPAGGYRISNVPEGVYSLTVSTGGAAGVWEGAAVKPGCDTPGVDFCLGSTPGSSLLLGATLPEAAVCGRSTPLSVTFRNTGEGTWRRREGHCLRHVGDAGAVAADAAQWELPAATAIAPGQSYAFSFDWHAPDRYGFYHLVFQMCQQGGVGRFGEIAERTVSVSSFLDVRPDQWAVAAVEAAKAAGIVQGYPGDLYYPDQAVTRAQMSVYVARALAGGDAGVPPGPAAATFADVPTGHWAFRYVEYCHDQGVVQGYGDGYHPDEVVNRAQMAVFVARAMCGGEENVPDPGCSEPVFPDVGCDFWARKHIQFIKAQGVTSGYPDGLYHPEWAVDRAQMAVYVARAFDLPL